MTELTQDILKKHLKYEPETGDFYWLTSHRLNKKGGLLRTPRKAGTNFEGYIRLRICGENIFAHNLAWFYIYGEWPKGIDHINMVRDDNRITNLRLATRSQNGANRRKQSRNKSGFKGVHWKTRDRRWAACLRVNQKIVFYRLFKTKEAAYVAYCQAALKYFGEFARLD
jgi:HNH endonuclease